MPEISGAVGFGALVAAAAWLLRVRRRALDEKRRARVPHSARRAARAKALLDDHMRNKAERRAGDRERKKGARRALLAGMSAERRAAFLSDEKQRKAAAEARLDEAYRSGPHVAFDLSYCTVQSDQEQRSLAKQIQFSYGSLKQSTRPVAMHVCSAPRSGKIHDLLFGGYQAKQWRAYFHDEHVTEVFDKEKLVFLTPDSPNLLEEVNDDDVYVIGGIVDRTITSRLSVTSATEHGVRTARFPLAELFDSPVKQVLNVNTAFVLLLAFRELGDWKAALEKAVPQRHRRSIAEATRRKAERRGGPREKAIKAATAQNTGQGR